MEMEGEIEYFDNKDAPDLFGVHRIHFSTLRRPEGDHFTETDSSMTEQQKVNGTGVARLKRAIACSWAGFAAAWKNEEAFRQELLLCLVLVPLACWLGDSGTERALLVGSLLLVLIVEILNTAVEAVVDRIGAERHELSGLAKDLGSTAVFLSLVNAGAIWLLVLLT